MKNKKRNGGFTLVELLATLAILSIVVSIGVGTITSVINKTNEKAYQTAKNNVVATAKNYIIENGSKFGWFDGTTECKDATECQYQCVNIKNLIDSGYFDNDILKSEIAKDEVLQDSDAVFLQRNKGNKTITHQIFEDGNQSTVCANFTEVGRIIFDYSSSWSKEKNVTITYIVNTQNVSGYSYFYDYSVDGDTVKNESGNFSSSNEKKVSIEGITSNGTLKATITSPDGSKFDKELVISRIDTGKPTVSISSNHKFTNTQEMTITLSDSGSGVVGYYFGTKDVEGDGDTVYDYQYTPINKTNSTSFTITAPDPDVYYWYVRAIDAADNDCESSYISLSKLNLMIGNNNAVELPDDLTISPGFVKDTSSSTYSLNDAKANVKLSSSNYSIVGWYKKPDLSESSKVSDIRINYKNLYAKVVPNEITSATVSIVGNATDNYLNTVVSNIILSNPEDTTADIEYSYQWYYIATNKNCGTNRDPGGTPLMYPAGGYADDKNISYYTASQQKGKYLYVEVTMKKNNYFQTKFFSSCYYVN